MLFRLFSNRPAAALAGLLAPLVTAAPAQAEEGPFAVWWSPELGLESLDKIDARLAGPLWPDHPDWTTDLYYWGDDDAYPRFIKAGNCLELHRLIELGYHGRYNADGQAVQSLALRCHVLELLKMAKPARVSYVRDFVLDEAAVQLLPALVDVAPSCEWACRQVMANERRISLAEFSPPDKVARTETGGLEIEVGGGSNTLSLLARADFNDDGLEDLLIFDQAHAIGGTWGTADFFLLTRDTPSGVLWDIDTEDDLCEDYQCEPAYDDPPALAR